MYKNIEKILIYIYHQFIFRFPIGLYFLFITFLLHFFLPWATSLSISCSAMSDSTLSNHVLLGRPIGLLPSTVLLLLSVCSPFSDRVGLPLQNIHNPPFTSIMDIFFVDLKFGHIHFYTL